MIQLLSRRIPVLLRIRRIKLRRFRRDLELVKGRREEFGQAVDFRVALWRILGRLC